MHLKIICITIKSIKLKKNLVRLANGKKKIQKPHNLFIPVDKLCSSADIPSIDESLDNAGLKTFKTISVFIIYKYSRKPEQRYNRA